MRRPIPLILLQLSFVLFVVGCSQKSSNSDLNHLAGQTSPYLMQHASNPIDWYPWGEEALNKAKEEDKLLVISIGYFSCHWCQVMEEETFTDTLVARMMNEDFVSIKVDREERPDVDAIYTAAAEAMIGTSGWPLNVVATPEGKPLFIGTYFENEDWKSIIERAAYLYEVDPKMVRNDADRLSSSLNQRKDNSAENTTTVLEVLDEKILSSLDRVFGGLNSEQKFPNAPLLHALMDQSFYTENAELDKEIIRMLEAMALGGTQDHLQGGFFRYSTDKEWKVPHFEKMLYDNAQLIGVYAKAAQKYKDPFFEEIAKNAADFILNDFRMDDGGFAASFNAVSDNEEGKSYIFTAKQLKQAGISEETLSLFNITENGNWEDGKNVLYTSPDERSRYINWKNSADFAQLREIIKQREQPEIDSKVLTGWNALLVSGLTELYRTSGEEQYLEAALDLMNFLIENRVNGNEVLRTEQVKDVFFLEDYAYLIDALINSYQVSLEESYLSLAKDLSEEAQRLFYADRQFKLSTENQLDLDIAQPNNDLAVPSGNAQMVKNLSALGTYYYDTHSEWLDLADQLLATESQRINEVPVFKGTWLQAKLLRSIQPYEVAILGESAKTKLRQFMSKDFRPDILYLGGNEEGDIPLLKNKLVSNRTMIYVCQNKACKLPTEDLETAYELTLD